jgi:hypothetical protein
MNKDLDGSTPLNDSPGTFDQKKLKRDLDRQEEAITLLISDNAAKRQDLEQLLVSITYHEFDRGNVMSCS